MSIQVALENRTPFVAEHFVLPDGYGGEIVLLIVKATFACDTPGAARTAASQRPIQLADAPGIDTDLAPHKPFVDVLVVDPHAWAPGGQPATSVMVGLRVGTLTKILRVTGDRMWLDRVPSRPAPFLSLPLTWARAFGGEDEAGRADLRNLVGTLLPNVEYPSDQVQRLGQRVRPAGLGVVARNVQPRVGCVGTYDAAWQRERWPLLPLDFDPRFHQSAPDDQWLDALGGDETIVCENLSPEGRWTTTVPRLDAPVWLFFADRSEPAELRVDTLELIPMRHELVLTARLAIPTQRDRGRLDEILVGHATPAWMRARTQHKRYVDLRKLGDDAS